MGKISSWIRDYGFLYSMKKIYERAAVKYFAGKRLYPFAISDEKRSAMIKKQEGFENRPLFSIVVPLYNTDLNYLSEMIDSVADQIYDRWELVIADASDDHVLREKIIRESSVRSGASFISLSERAGGSDGVSHISIYEKDCESDGVSHLSISERVSEINGILNTDRDNSNKSEQDDALGLNAGSIKMVKYIRLSENNGISENTNAAISIATGDYIGLLDHDDLLHSTALFWNAYYINKTGADFLYSDELSFAGDTSKVQSINIKPDFSRELLYSNNYICHFSVLGRELIYRLTHAEYNMPNTGQTVESEDNTDPEGKCAKGPEAKNAADPEAKDINGPEGIYHPGLFRKEYDGAQDYDLFLRASVTAKRIVHIPQVLYYWRLSAGSTASGIGAKDYATEAGRRALEDHLKEAGVPFLKVSSIKGMGPFYRAEYREAGNGHKKAVIIAEDQKAFEQLSENSNVCHWKDFLSRPESFCREFSELIFLRSGYKPEHKDSVNMLLSDLLPEYNEAAGGLGVSGDGFVEEAGYAVLNGYGVRPLFRKYKKTDPGYMYRLVCRYEADLYDGPAYAVKSSVLKDFIGLVPDNKDMEEFICLLSCFIYLHGSCTVTDPHSVFVNDSARGLKFDFGVGKKLDLELMEADLDTMRKMIVEKHTEDESSSKMLLERKYGAKAEVLEKYHANAYKAGKRFWIWN
ncbi:MAG: glycosyltransferase [Lachnospiraceae bacterium]|jgi:glycosyltransferase involved in cell wall biosynthesis|nr:glycosyltransferase [Lachnospiraceae bacterium]MEE3461042.1 glycosyltransferase [Lachnospiraceae bacterium]